jgi:uncharacterized protein DUF3617
MRALCIFMQKRQGPRRGALEWRTEPGVLRAGRNQPRGPIMPAPRSRHAARAAALAAAVLCGALYAQSINLQPGLYEVVSTSQVSLTPQMQKALPPGYVDKLQQPHTSQQCVSDADLKHVSKQLTEERGNDPSCKLTASAVTGDKVSFDMRCQRTTSHFEGTFSATSFKAQVDAQTDRGPMKIKMSGRRLGGCSK